jgi:hypothetical protein
LVGWGGEGRRKERRGKERKGKERKGKERKTRERKGKGGRWDERKGRGGKEREEKGEGVGQSRLPVLGRDLPETSEIGFISFRKKILQFCPKTGTVLEPV